MKRLWISVALILMLTSLSIFNVQKLGRFINQLERQLQLVQLHLHRGDWENAEVILLKSYKQWEEKGFYLHTTLRHDDIDEIRSSFCESLAYLRQREDSSECAAVLARLRNSLSLLLDAELPTAKNLL